MAWAHAIALWLACAVLVSVAAVLVRRVLSAELDAFDRSLLTRLTAWSSPSLDAALRVPSLLGTWSVFMAMAGATFVALALRDRAAAIRFAIAVVGSALHYGVLNRLIFSRQRPETLDPLASGVSFPSGHAVMLLGYALALAIVLPVASRPIKRAIGAALIAFALALGVVRVVLALHHPSDVIAGWVLALGWVLGVLGLLEREASVRPRLARPRAGRARPRRWPRELCRRPPRARGSGRSIRRWQRRCW